MKGPFAGPAFGWREAPRKASGGGAGSSSRLRSSTALGGLGRGLTLETMEPRLLLSADLAPLTGALDRPGETDLFRFGLTALHR